MGDELKMMAPNPHWWAEDVEDYCYDRGKFNPGLFVMIFWMAFIGLPIVWPASESVMPLMILGGMACLLIYAGLVGEPPPHRFETRYTFITQYHGDELLAHESMRDLVSLEPVMNPKKGKLQYHQAKFWNGKAIKIYPSLERHDELIAKLNDSLKPES